ncbi:MULTISPECIES: CusA/CzcA family heavy metal efflux RND transporter [Methylobacterium]|uniref:Cobalt-zinc-cadmium resistance protein CzcA n=9 Tax=Pseudomonadota TaxID=1224 RepID=A0ABQ4T0C3_9HYPH|nr:MULTISPECIES: CusA/CzcA family heavy metal efflux RND transporter [Methylobacterium]PIU04106.1 MAG: CusA/CzcA family heavy metal efflux RND transporter [Methylobacterium sp. CG09_land_8_20_14_0_10_71_15]PIU11644.1 MAG: CusA/CzcA family heavy metal efflux RND transporter [Methylobacterium sp. CG08_land_8_20_14_0_20_71_15]GBU17642.1 copper/silver efflux system [Methylobacterium sp.]GJE08230.1 Cobalt-zinc-cadmium resistance protein CzcA [Methylobacterium jeotgali]
MNALIVFSLRQRVLVFLMFVVMLALGYASYRQLNIEAYPDPVPPLVDVITQNPGQSADEIERYITIPLEVALAGIPNATVVRTISLFGLSDVKVQFNYAYTYQEALQRVLNRLSQLPPLPNGAQPQISPTSPVGEIMRYKLVGPAGYSSTDLKTLQDWVLQRRFKAIPGVVDVTAFGGKAKEYEIAVDLNRLQGQGLTLVQVVNALNNSSINVGGQTLNVGEQSAVVRGVGLIRDMDDIRDTLLTQVNGTPVLVRDVADVRISSAPRLGIVGHDGQSDIVEGIVLMSRGGQSLPTLRRVEAEIDKINASTILPPDVRIERIYDRSGLINTTTHTVMHNLVFGVVLVFVVQWLFLGSLRSAIIVAATIPFALGFAIIIMVARGDSANLLSLGAIDFGLIVDATVIMVENVFRHLAEPEHSEGQRAPGGLEGRLGTIAIAGAEVNRAIFFSATIIIVGFLPLFTMTGVEGHIFGPMAKTYAYALVGGLIATFTVSPALSALILPKHVEEHDTLIVRLLRFGHRIILRVGLAHKLLCLGLTLAVLLVAGIAGRNLGLEFLPKLEEGNLYIRGTMPASISLEAGNAYVERLRTIVGEVPEVVTVLSHQGRPSDGTDATGFFNAEILAPLKPIDQWRPGLDKETLIRDLSKRLETELPGIEFNFSQYIEDNVQEAASGVKGENSVKIYGTDLNEITKAANQVKAVLATVPGITDLSVFASLGQPTVRIDVDRRKAARFGLSIGDVNTTLQAAIGGQTAGDLYEYGSDRHFPMRVRLAPEYRRSLETIRNITIGAQNPNGGVVQVPISEIATVELVSGAAFIYREDQERYIPVKFSVRGRDLGGAVIEAQKRVEEEVQLPAGYHLEWVGQFTNLQDAVQRLSVVVPVTLALIALLLFINFSSVADMLLVLSVIPMAMIGGIFALFLTGTPFSISAAIGFIALFGISTMEGVILLAYYNQLMDEGWAKREAVWHAAMVRMRPVMMTCVAACVGLLPAAISTGIGSQVQKPLALVVVGGILLAPNLILVVVPVLISLFSRRRSNPKAQPRMAGSAAA